MAIGSNGEPPAGRKLDMSQEVPSPAVHDEIVHREALERIDMEANAGKFSGRVAFLIRGSLRPSAELITLFVATSGSTALVWGICHVEGVDGRTTLAASLLFYVANALAGGAFLRAK